MDTRRLFWRFILSLALLILIGGTLSCGEEVKAGGLRCGGVYRWTVRARDSAGNYSGWSSWLEFSFPLG